MVQDFRVSPLARSRHSSHKPAVVRAGEPSRGEIPGLFAVRRVLPLVVTRRGDQASRALKRVAKEWLGFDRLHSRIECRHLHVLDGLAQPARHQAPAHGHELALAVGGDDHIDGICGADVVAGLRDPCRLIERQPVQLHQFFRGQPIGESSAHQTEPSSCRYSQS